MKHCNACEQTLPDDGFYSRSCGRLITPCKQCLLAKRKADYSENREHVRDINRRACAKFRAANAEQER